MLIKSALATQMSGSIGGLTGSRNRSGLYLRARAVPVDPNTSRQQVVKSSMTSLVNAWVETLTDPQRVSWNDYAANVPVTNALGDSVNNTGQNWFVACNVPRLQSNAPPFSNTLPRVDAAPVLFDRGDFTDTVITLSEASGFSMTFDNTDAWANEDDSAMLIYMGLPYNASRNFFKGPYRLLAVLLGDGTTPPTSPLTAPTSILQARGFDIAEGQKCSFAVAVTRVDGRLTTRRVQTTVVAA